MAKDKGKKGKGKKLPDVAVGADVLTPVFRVGFIGLPDDDGKYSVKALFDKDADVAEMESLALVTLRSKFGDDIELDDYKLPWNDGDKQARKKGKGDADVSHLEGTVYCNIGTRYLPTLVDEKGKPLLPDDSKKLYSGMYARAIVNAYAYEYADKDGVSFGLIGLERVADGEKIAAGGMSFDDVRDRFNKVPVDAPKGAKKAKDDKKDKKDDKKDKKGKGKR